MKINGWELISQDKKSKVFKKGDEEVFYQKFRIGFYAAGVRKIGEKTYTSLTLPLGQNVKKENEVFKIIKLYMEKH